MSELISSDKMTDDQKEQCADTIQQNCLIFDLYDPTGETSLMYKAAMEFCAVNIAPYNNGFQKDDANFPREIMKKLGKEGYLGVNAPTEYGGLGGTYLQQQTIIAAISYWSPSIALSVLAHIDLCMHRIVTHGTPEQKQKYLPGLISGDLIGALAMSEPNAGSDVVGGMTTKAERTEDHEVRTLDSVEDVENSVTYDAVPAQNGYVLNGTKTWITNGNDADVIIVYAKTDFTSDKDNMTTYIVEKDMVGFEATKKLDKIGMRGSNTSELTFTNCFIPDTNILGSVGKGANVLVGGLKTERITLSVAANELAQFSLDYVMKYAEKREQFGQPLAGFQSMAFDLTKAQFKLDAAKTQTFFQAALFDCNKTLTLRNASSAYYNAGKAAQEITTLCINKMGGNGFMREYDIGQYNADSHLYQNGGGTPEMRLDAGARELMPVYGQQQKLVQKLLKAYKAGTITL